MIKQLKLTVAFIICLPGLPIIIFAWAVQKVTHYLLFGEK